MRVWILEEDFSDVYNPRFYHRPFPLGPAQGFALDFLQTDRPNGRPMSDPSPIRAVIVDDEPLARQYVRQLLGGDAGVEIVGECGNGTEAIDVLNRTPADLLFLDIEMPETDGFALLEALKDPPPVVVFVTAHDRYAVRAFEVQAFDYLLKPFDEERFGKVLARAKERLGKRGRDELLSELRQLVGEMKTREQYLERILVRAGDRSLFVPASDVDWIEAEANYVRIHAGAQSYLLRESIGAIGDRLDPKRFRRIHRSAIVNLDRVKELQPWFHGEHRLLLKDGTELRVSRTYRKNVGELAGD
jgi:two-component system LytT family response regulator